MDKRNKSLLLYLAEASDRQLSAFLKIADRDQIYALKEATLNLLLGNLPVTEEAKKKLKRHKKFLRAFAQKGSNADLKGKAKIIKVILKVAGPAVREI